MDKLIAFLNERPFVVGDGAMGTMLQAAGLDGRRAGRVERRAGQR